MQGGDFGTITPVLPACELRDVFRRIRSGSCGRVRKAPLPSRRVTDEAPRDAGDDRADVEASTTLRGAAVSVDPKRAGVVAGVLCVAALVVSGLVLLVAGAHQNAQITALKTRGQPAEATVVSCLGELGGSGSNGAGYSCRATYRVAGHEYRATLPGMGFSAPRTKVSIVVDGADPTLISTPRILASQHPSAQVFVLPLVLLGSALAIGWVLWRRRDRGRIGGDVQPARRSLPESGGDDRLGALGGV